MNIGKTIKELRLEKGITQENLAEALNVTVQSVSRWENEINAPDLSVIPLLSAFFNVTSDYLLGLQKNDTTARLLKTVETFELDSKEDADNMILRFKGEQFPVLREYRITFEGKKVILEVTKDFNFTLGEMVSKFKGR